MSGWRSVEFGWRRHWWHRNENKSRCAASRAGGGGDEPRCCSETQPPLSQREPGAWAHSAPSHLNSFIRIFCCCVAKTNVKTFLPSFWVMSIRLIWSAKICDLSDSNSEWAAPRHLPTSEPPCAHMLCAWPSGCSPYGESHEYLMCQIRTHALHHTFSLTHVINQSSNW